MEVFSRTGQAQVFLPEKEKRQPIRGLPLLVLPNPLVCGLRQVVAEAGPEHIVDAFGADAAQT
jgi:hypothetical protein